MSKKLYIIGVGPGGIELCTEKATSIVRSADRVMSTRRISEIYPTCQGFVLAELLEELKRTITGTTVVLVGGDCCFFSVASQIVRDFSRLYEIELVNGIGSIAYFSAKIQIPYDNANLLSLHGKNELIVPRVAYNKKVYALTGGVFKAHDIFKELAVAGLGNLKAVVGENLSYPNERVVYGTVSELQTELFDDLAVVYVENENAVEPHAPLRDTDFVRSEKIPMTKEEIRWIALQKLTIFPKNILYDIGAGTGSVAVEMGRKATEGIVYAIEQNADACELIKQNRVKHGAFNVNIVHASAPDGLADLPEPDAAFIGGSRGNAESIIKALFEKNPKIRVVATAVSLQGLHQLHESLRKFGSGEVETICVNVARSKRFGSYDMMQAQNPVYILCKQ